jgi:hypothetical protein
MSLLAYSPLDDGRLLVPLLDDGRLLVPRRLPPRQPRPLRRPQHHGHAPRRAPRRFRVTMHPSHCIRVTLSESLYPSRHIRVREPRIAWSGRPRPFISAAAAYTYRGHVPWSCTLVTYLHYVPWSRTLVTYLGHVPWSRTVVTYRGHVPWSRTVVTYLGHVPWSRTVVDHGPESDGRAVRTRASLPYLRCSDLSHRIRVIHVVRSGCRGRLPGRARLGLTDLARAL